MPLYQKLREPLDDYAKQPQESRQLFPGQQRWRELGDRGSAQAAPWAPRWFTGSKNPSLREVPKRWAPTLARGSAGPAGNHKSNTRRPRTTTSSATWAQRIARKQNRPESTTPAEPQDFTDCRPGRQIGGSLAGPGSNAKAGLAVYFPKKSGSLPPSAGRPRPWREAGGKSYRPDHADRHESPAAGPNRNTFAVSPVGSVATDRAAARSPVVPRSQAA